MSASDASSRTSADDIISTLRAMPPSNSAGIARAGLLAINAGRDEDALPILASAATGHPSDARIAQAWGLAARNIGDLATAVQAFTRARRLAPNDGLIAHSLARSRLEAGLPALDEFAAARRLVPNDGSIVLGEAAARFAAGDLSGAEAGLDNLLRTNPLWLEGHATLARLRRMAGDVDVVRSYREALATHPRQLPLALALCDTLVAGERFADLPPLLAAIRSRLGGNPTLDLFEAAAADELGDRARAAALFARLPTPDQPSALAWHVRHHLREGRPDLAASLAEPAVNRDGGRSLWPYLALAWRQLGDARWHWLEGDERFVRVVDLPGLDLAALGDRLRSLHLARDQPLDQSVRGGTQTDGPLFSRIDPEIVALTAAVRQAVNDYVAGLPAPDPRHPLLGPARAPIRFAGSWSVRLRDGGFHTDHVHPQGWISSALYVSLPPDTDPERQEGWLTLGAARTLLPTVTPFRTIEPVPGRLVLFPSTMWHGTLPFPVGERLTVAFDVALRVSGP